MGKKPKEEAKPEPISQDAGEKGYLGPNYMGSLGEGLKLWNQDHMLMTESRPLSSQFLGKGWGLIAMS